MDRTNKRMIYFLLDEIEAKKDLPPVSQPFEEYAQLASICNDGIINDNDAKWEYKKITEQIKKKCLEMTQHRNNMVPKWRQLYWETLRSETFDFFESYLYFLEMKRPYEKKFYEPRAKTLKTVADDLQALADGKYKFYGLSLPARTGKSTICVFFLSWLALRNPESHSAMGGHSGFLADHFYKELLDVFTTDDYTFGELYTFWHPDGKGLVDKSAEKRTISFETTGDFPTLTCQGIDGTWTGNVDVSSDGILYVDDLVRDRAHSLSPTRMNNTYLEFLNKMVDRMNDGAKLLMVGTLWNVLDPLMRMEEVHGHDKRYLFRRIPALDFKTDESNFAYDVKGFSTQYYREMREQMIASGAEADWWAKYQQKPYVREGLLFPLNELGFFNGILAEGDYNYVAVCDTAFGGGDHVSMPVGLKDNNTGVTYIVDWYYSDGGVQITIPGICDMIVKHGIQAITFERNNGGLLYAKQVDEELQKRNYLCACDTKPAPVNISKEDKIKSCEGKIKTQLRFLENSALTDEQKTAFEEEGYMVFKKSRMYEEALNDLSTFVTIGKNATDDAADSIAMLVLKIYGDSSSVATVEVWSRASLGF